MVTGLNHITLTVSDLEQSLEFYANILGFKALVRWDTGAYLSAGDLWLCLTKGVPCSKQDYTHIAFSVTKHDFSTLLEKAITDQIKQWQENSSEGESLYILDPDGHQLELHVGNLQSRLDSLVDKPYSGLEWLV